MYCLGLLFNFCIGRVRFCLDRLILASLVFVLYNAHWSVHFCLIEISLQNYDKVSINSVYTIIITKCVKNCIYSIILHQSVFSRVSSHRKTTLTFILNHRLIKKGVNKQIKLFSLGKGGASHYLRDFPFRKVILVFIVLLIHACVQMLCINYIDKM